MGEFITNLRELSQNAGPSNWFEVSIGIYVSMLIVIIISLCSTIAEQEWI